MIAAYDRHLYEMPAGFGVRRLMEVGVGLGYIQQQPDRSLLVSATPVER